MIRHESIVTALVGAVLGVVTGLFLTVLVITDTRDVTDLAIPARTIAAFVAVAVAAGIAAAVLPARRASRLNVLDAVAYE